MPFLRDEGPPVSQASMQRARESLPLEYGVQTLNETGREVLLVRVPKAKPDYLHDLADVAFYVTLDMIRNCKDVLLLGHEKTARLEPQLLRDHIRAQDREDADLVPDLRRKLGRDFGQMLAVSPANHLHQALVVRIPKTSVNDFSPDDVKAIRSVVEQQSGRFDRCQYAYVIADRDHERLGRRVLLELIGAPIPGPEPLAPQPAAQPSAPSPQPAAPAPFAFPMTPGTAAAPNVANAATGALPAMFTQKPVTLATAHAAPPAPPVAPTPAAAPAQVDITETDEYAIVSKVKPPAPVAEPAHAAAPAMPSADVHVEEEYEITTKPKAPEPAASAAAPMPEHPEVERNVHTATEEFEVYTSKPKPKPAGPAITPPGQGGFQNAFSSATAGAPTRSKEYQIQSRPAAHAADGNVARMLSHTPKPAPVDDPRIAPAFVAAPAPAPTPPPAQAPAPFVVSVVPADPEKILAARFKEAGYEIVEGLRAQGTVFAFAAHKPNGRRVLVKRATDFAAEDAATLAQLLAALGADVGLVVADRIAPGTRLATWGTRIEVYSPTEVAACQF